MKSADLLFSRDVVLKIGKRNGGGIMFKTQRIISNKLERNTNLMINFDIKKSVKDAVSTGTIEVNNVSRKTFEFLTDEVENLQVELEVGHSSAENRERIFFADIIDINFDNRRNGTILEINAEEGLYLGKLGVLNKSYPPNTKMTEIVSDCKSVLTGLGLSDLKYFKVFSDLNKERNKAAKSVGNAGQDIIAETILPNGFTANESVLGVLNRLLRDKYNYKIYMSNNNLIIAHPGAEIEDLGLVLSPKTGLIGSPKIINGRLKAKALIQPKAKLGSRIYVKNEDIDSEFIIDDIAYSGSSLSGDYCMEIEAV